MPLIDLKTNLKSLKFGNDLPGYGSSGLPYIQTTLPNNNSGNMKPLFNPTSTGGLDYPIRGGSVEFQLGNQSYTLSSLIDYERIKKFLSDKSRGPAFIQKQIGLQLSNPKIETGNTLFGQFNTTQILPGLIENTRIYNDGRNTLEQVKNQGTGVHIPRIGLTPNSFLEKYYADIVGAQNLNNESATNRLLILQKLKMSSTVVSTNISLVNKLGISLDRNLLFNYQGGPGSTYGIGSTIIRRADDTTKATSMRAMMYDDLMKQNSAIIENGRLSVDSIKDFRETLGLKSWNYKTEGLDYKFYVNGNTYKDKMNLLSSVLFKNDQSPWSLENLEGANKDIIKFVFECIDNDDPTTSIALFFRAFLTAGLTDNNTAELNSFKYMGRGETFYTYQGFNRSINFSFRIATFSKSEMQPLYSKLNRLISQVYPDYSDKGIMRAPLVKITIGDYLYRMPGFIESINTTIDNNTSWEIDDNAQLPHYVDVNVAFKPIFNTLPRRATIGNETALITNPDNSYIEQDAATIGAQNALSILSSANAAAAQQSKLSQEREAIINRELLNTSTFSLKTGDLTQLQ